MSIHKDLKEVKVEDYLVKRAELQGGVAKKLKEDSRRGFSDRTLMLPLGYIAFVELKRPVGGVISEHQKKHRSDLIKLGMRHYVAVTYAEVDAIFDDYALWKDELFDTAGMFIGVDLATEPARTFAVNAEGHFKEVKNDD